MLNHKSKKADLSLSVNAIVVLILAIVMLGLALGFVKTMFGKSANQFDEIISTEKDPEQADVNEPIKLSKGTISLKAKEVGVLKVSVFNPGFVDYGELERTGEAYLAGTPQNKVIKPEFVIDNMKGCFDDIDITKETTGYDDRYDPMLKFNSQSKQLIPSRTSKVVGLSFVPKKQGDFVCAICTNKIGKDYENIAPSGTPNYRASGDQYCTSLRVIVKP